MWVSPSTGWWLDISNKDFISFIYPIKHLFSGYKKKWEKDGDGWAASCPTDGLYYLSSQHFILFLTISSRFSLTIIVSWPWSFFTQGFFLPPHRAEYPTLIFLIISSGFDSAFPFCCSEENKPNAVFCLFYLFVSFTLIFLIQPKCPEQLLQ